jgi:hypothetical protein
MPRAGRPTPGKSHSEPTPRNAEPSRFQRVSLRSTQKTSVFSFLLEDRRQEKCLQGAALLNEANQLLKDIKKRLDDPVKEEFEARVEEYVQLSYAHLYAYLTLYLRTGRWPWSTRCSNVQRIQIVFYQDSFTSISSILRG